VLILVSYGRTVILEVWVGAGRVLLICGVSSEVISDCVKNNEFGRFCSMKEVLFLQNQKQNEPERRH